MKNHPDSKENFLRVLMIITQIVLSESILTLCLLIELRFYFQISSGLQVILFFFFPSREFIYNTSQNRVPFQYSTCERKIKGSQFYFSKTLLIPCSKTLIQPLSCLNHKKQIIIIFYYNIIATLSPVIQQKSFCFSIKSTIPTHIVKVRDKVVEKTGTTSEVNYKIRISG